MRFKISVEGSCLYSEMKPILEQLEKEFEITLVDTGNIVCETKQVKKDGKT